MDLKLRNAIADVIQSEPTASSVISALNMKADGSGSITYNSKGVWVDPGAMSFSGATAVLGDEELVRAYLLVRLASFYGYQAKPEILEAERCYASVGRPGKGGRIDVLVRKPSKGGKGDPFLFIECKAPDKFDSDINMIDGQLFRLSKQEAVRPRFLVYYTVEMKADALRERIILIDTDTFPDYDSWNESGQPITDTIPSKYGLASKRRYANVTDASHKLCPLDCEATPATLHRLRIELQDVIWGGGGTNNNEVFSIITKLILCKIYDEKETPPGKEYEFQRYGDAVAPESPSDLIVRMNDLYRVAEESYLALPNKSEGPAFDTGRIAEEKLAYVVGRLESLSITENKHPGDLLGEFFEQIVSQDFTQSKGQFFTPMKLVRFMLHLADAAENAKTVMLTSKDHLGRHRLPHVIDPSCGSGTFLIEYMKLIRRSLGRPEVAKGLTSRVRESYTGWFAGTGNSWARDYLFGIENNYDLGLAAKVNMVLHGDGSMNTWIKSGLLPFSEYFVAGRNNVLGMAKPRNGHPYLANRNEQFDFILSNPPFSIKLAPDEKTKVRSAFHLMASAKSEAVFIERWYQLLCEGGSFCCILPEAILDTSTYSQMRLFLLKSFRINAVVSLPYDAFRPFTSTKCCIVYATKRSAKDITKFDAALALQEGGLAKKITAEVLQNVFDELGWADEPIFMAEPKHVGYKRRKNLPDLHLPNCLYQEDAQGELATIDVSNPSTVLDYYKSGQSATPNSRLGFWTSIRNITSRTGIRLDPKYRWLWDYQQGVVYGDRSRSVELSKFLGIVQFPKLPKGDLPEELKLLDLEYVESRQAIVRDDLPSVDRLGSDKIKFVDCDLVISKLEPYLGKIILEPNPEYVGSTEWVGLKSKTTMPRSVLAYLLMLPEMCEAYRRLQSGKRHARFDPKEFLKLRFEPPVEADYLTLAAAIEMKRQSITDMRRGEMQVREQIDGLFSLNGSTAKKPVKGKAARSP